MDDAQGEVRVTHPFHPLRGRSFRYLYSRNSWGLDRVFCEGDEGEIRSFPRAWTNFADPDPFVTVSAGRSSFRVRDLQELADFCDRLRAPHSGEV